MSAALMLGLFRCDLGPKVNEKLSVSRRWTLACCHEKWHNQIRVHFRRAYKQYLFWHCYYSHLKLQHNRPWPSLVVVRLGVHSVSSQPGVV